MKTTFYSIISFVLIICLFACSSSDDDGGEPATDFVGTWNLTSLGLENAYDFNNDGTESIDLTNEFSCFDSHFFELRADGTMVFSREWTELDLVVSGQNEYSYTHECNSDDDLLTTWEQEGNTITLTIGNNEFFGVKFGNEITILYVNDFIAPIFNGTTVVDLVEDVTAVYTKQ